MRQDHQPNRKGRAITAISATRDGKVLDLTRGTDLASGNQNRAATGNKRSAPPGAKVTARAVKITVVMEPAAVVAALQPFATVEHHVPMVVEAEGRNLTAEFAPKAVRRALAAIREFGTDACVTTIVGKLRGDNSIAEAGLMAQPKTPKPAKDEQAAA